MIVPFLVLALMAPGPTAAPDPAEVEVDSYGVTRGSGVLRKTRDGWKIEQYVLSFAVPNDKARAVVEAIEGPE